MNSRLRGTIVVLGALAVVASASCVYAAGLAAPTEVEAHALPGGKVSISWKSAAGATSYNVYRSTTSGGQGAIPIGSTTSTSYTDTGLSSGSPTLYYKVAAANGGAVSPQSEETASPALPRTSPGTGAVAGIAQSGGWLFYGKDGLGSGFDWFNATPSMCDACPDWFPQWLSAQPGALTPGGTVVDMAYSETATLSFNNVVVPSTGLYNIDFRYAFGPGLFPSVTNREMGLQVNGTVVATHLRFPITGSFATYQHALTQARLNAGKNAIMLFAVTDHGISRVDQMLVTPATSSLPGDPTHLTGVAGNGQVALSWTGSTGATSYRVYRGTAFDGEATTPIATVTSPSYTDTSAINGTLYFYVVAAANSAGTSGDSEQITMTPMAPGGTSGPVAISCGGSAASPFVADTDFGSGTTSSTTHSINTSNWLTSSVPQSVLQTNRHGQMTYRMGGFAPGSSHTVTLYFVEHFFSAAGKRVFDVIINGTKVLSGFDVFADAGGQYIAVQHSFTTTANPSGQVVVQFVTGAVDNPIVNAIAVN